MSGEPYPMTLFTLNGPDEIAGILTQPENFMPEELRIARERALALLGISSWAGSVVQGHADSLEYIAWVDDFHARAAIMEGTDISGYGPTGKPRQLRIGEQ